jgi:hypothetical protein
MRWVRNRHEISVRSHVATKQKVKDRTLKKGEGRDGARFGKRPLQKAAQFAWDPEEKVKTRTLRTQGCGTLPFKCLTSAYESAVWGGEQKSKEKA